MMLVLGIFVALETKIFPKHRVSFHLKIYPVRILLGNGLSLRLETKNNIKKIFKKKIIRRLWERIRVKTPLLDPVAKRPHVL